MTTPTTEPGTAVAKAKPDYLGALPPALQAAMRLRAGDAAMRAEIAKQSWGANLDANQARAISTYCQRHNIDISEVHILGGQLYRNAQFYLSRLARMIEAGLVEYAVPDYITADPRLKALAASPNAELAREAAEEDARRTMERIKWQVDDGALSACVFRVKVKGTAEIAGCKAVYDTKSQSTGKYLDPVGVANPPSTAESRAARRCLKKLVPSLPPAERQMWETVEAEWEKMTTEVGVVAGDIDDDRSAPVALPGGATFRAAGAKTTPLISHGDGYDAPEATVGGEQPAPMREPGEEEDEDLALDIKLAAEEAKPKKGK